MIKFITAKKHTSSIVEVPIPDGVWSHICQYVPGAKDLEDPPHITLCCMQDLGKGKLEQVQEALKSFCAQWAPMQVTITGAGKFPSDKDKVPHFAKISSPQLVKFRDAVIECIQDIDPDLIDMESFPNFTPHLTVQYVSKEEKLPVIKPIAFTLRSISLSFKGTDKTFYPLSLASDMQGLSSESPTSSPHAALASIDIITTASLKQLASNISVKLASLGYEAESIKIAETAQVLGKKKKHKKDTSVQKFQKKLRDQLKQYVPYHHMDIATHSILNLLMDDMGHDAPGDHRDDEGLFGGDGDTNDSPGDSDSGSDTGGGEGGGEGGEGGGGAEGEAVEALGPHMEGVDSHIMTRMKGMQSVVDPTANKATPFMERNYSAELRTWLRRHHS